MTAERARVLLVEDNPADARLVRELLSERGGGYDIVHRERLDAALEAARLEAFDVMLLDLSLPDASGIGTLKRAHEAAPGLPIVIMTGLGDEAMARRAMAEESASRE